VGSLRRIASAVAALGAVLGLAAAAGADTVDRVPLAPAGGSLTAGIPPGAFLVLPSPPGYNRQAIGANQGAWTGPDYWASGRRDLGGKTSIAWTLRFDNRSKDTDVAARAGLQRNWARDINGGVSVSHVVLGHIVGTIDGDFVLTAGSGSADASYELSMAFGVAPHVDAVVDFLLTSPATASAGAAGTFLVNGSIPAPIWNRGQGFRAMAGVQIEGNLPPSRITAVAAKNGTVLRGAVKDAFHHPLLRTRVTLQRLVGSSWRRVTSTRTDLVGNYSIRIGGAAEYRVVSTLGKTTATSATVSAGRASA